MSKFLGWVTRGYHFELQIVTIWGNPPALETLGFIDPGLTSYHVQNYVFAVFLNQPVYKKHKAQYDNCSMLVAV